MVDYHDSSCSSTSHGGGGRCDCSPNNTWENYTKEREQRSQDPWYRYCILKDNLKYRKSGKIQESILELKQAIKDIQIKAEQEVRHREGLIETYILQLNAINDLEVELEGVIKVLEKKGILS
jgi:hypothetical protein